MSPKLSPISWKKLVKGLKKFGFKGPYWGGKHPYMIKEHIVLTLPNPHKKEISIALLRKILKHAGISVKDWIEKI